MRLPSRSGLLARAALDPLMDAAARGPMLLPEPLAPLPPSFYHARMDLPGTITRPPANLHGRPSASRKTQRILSWRDLSVHPVAGWQAVAGLFDRRVAAGSSDKSLCRCR